MKVLIYGASGSGKTTFWATFPGPILAVICSGGYKPGELRSVDTPENRGRISQVVLRESTELKTLVDYLRGESNGQYKTVVLDHVSGLQDLILKETLGLEELPAQKFWGLAQREQYGQVAQQCKEYLRALLNLSQNVVIIGQERTFGGSEDGISSEVIRPTVGVAVTPSLAGWLYPCCDYVLQLFKRPKMIQREVEAIKGQGKTIVSERVKGIEYCARCEPHETYTTKFRLPKGRTLPDVIVDPDYGKLVAIITGVQPKK